MLAVPKRVGKPGSSLWLLTLKRKQHNEHPPPFFFLKLLVEHARKAFQPDNFQESKTRTCEAANSLILHNLAKTPETQDMPHERTKDQLRRIRIMISEQEGSDETHQMVDGRPTAATVQLHQDARSCKQERPLESLTNGSIR